MFCPNCGTQNQDTHIYCRSCGLKLDAIVHAVAQQFPSDEYARLQRRKNVLETIGVICLAIFGLIGFSFLFAKVIQYKLDWLGADVLFWSGIIAMLTFGLLSVFFFNYPKLAMKFDEINPRLPSPDEKPASYNTSKLIEDRHFEPASVTEHSTELLPVDAHRQGDDQTP
ncbi:MAG: zinc-ribbon domain-containing protein [Pyrinomonadaceae bacterium]